MLFLLLVDLEKNMDAEKPLQLQRRSIIDILCSTISNSKTLFLLCVTFDFTLKCTQCKL